MKHILKENCLVIQLMPLQLIMEGIMNTLCYKRGSSENQWKVCPSGMFVDHWLAGSPDAIVTDSSKIKHHKGCLEECPYVCNKHSIEDACNKVKGFCLVGWFITTV